MKHGAQSVPGEGAPIDSDQSQRWFDGRHWHESGCNGTSFPLEECGDVIAYTCQCGSAFTGWSG